MSSPVVLNPWPSFFMVAVGVFLSTMDSSMVNVALPSIMRTFDATLIQTEWVSLMYLLTITVTLLIWGRMADCVGKGRVYMLGMLVFSLGSVACYLAPSLLILVFCRLVQAGGASMMMSSGPAIVKMVFPRRQLGRALGLIGLATSVGLMSGPVISGFLIRYFSWRILFLVTVPVSLGCCVVGWFWLQPIFSRPPADECAPPASFDWSGLVLWTLLIVLTVLLATHHVGASGGLLLPGIAGVCILGYLLVVNEQRSANPLLPLVLLRERYYSIAMLCALLSFTVLFVVLLLIPFYLDSVLRLPPDRIGFVMMAVPVAVFVISPLAGWLYDRMGARVLTTTGLVWCCLALISLCFLDERSEVVNVVWRLMLLGAGQALFLSPNSASILATVTAPHVGITSGMLATARNVGMLAGVTLAGLVFGEAFFLLSGGLDIKDFTVGQTAAFVRSLQISFGLAAGLAMVGALLSRERP